MPIKHPKGEMLGLQYLRVHVSNVTIRILFMRSQKLLLPESTLSSADLGWAQERRLEFIEFRLFWEGRINRGGLVSFFGISVPQASLDIARYMELAPGNLVYDAKRKVYRGGQHLKFLFGTPNSLVFLNQLTGSTTGALLGTTSVLGWVPPHDMVVRPTRSIPPETLQRVNRAIRERQDLEITYQSMRRSAAMRTWISPHAIASDGARWHVRAWSQSDRHFRDFVLARILNFHASRPASRGSELDTEWNSLIDVMLRPKPALNPRQRRAVAMEFGMTRGALRIRVRHALLPYFLRQMRFEGAAMKSSELVVANENEVREVLQRYHAQ